MLSKIFFVLFICGTWASSLIAAPHLSDPELVIDHNRITQNVRSLSVSDDDSRILAVAKNAGYVYDKYGNLISTLRVPHNEGSDGEISDGIISHDGKKAYVGGSIGLSELNTFLLCEFDTSSGKLLRTLGGFGSSLQDLSLNRRGNLLAVGLTLGGGFAVIDLESYLTVFSDSNYEKESRASVLFSPDGKFLAVNNRASSVTLYQVEPEIKRLGTTRVVTPENISAMQFSPKSDQLIFGLTNGKLETWTLMEGEVTDQKAANVYLAQSAIFAMAFCTKFDRFVAAGAIEINKMKVVTYWDKEILGPYKYYPGLLTTNCWAIAPLKSGGLVFGGDKGEITLTDEYLSPLWKLDPFYENELYHYNQPLKTNVAGTSIQFPIANNTTDIGSFDLETGQLTFNQERPLLSPLTEGLGLTDLYTSHPKKNNIELLPANDRNDRNTAVSVSRSASGFVLGSYYYLYKYNELGKLNWSYKIPDTAQYINITPDDRIVLIALQNGTIQWRRYIDGMLLLTFYLFPDRSSWLCWTPTGYYTTGEKGRDLFGWQVNHGFFKEPDYFKAGEFNLSRKRPDIIRKVLVTLDEPEAVRLANIERGSPQIEPDLNATLPPVVTIVSPLTESSTTQESLTVRFKIQRPNDEPVTAVQLLVDGVPVSETRGLKLVSKNDDVQSRVIKIPRSDCVITIRAENRYGVSEPAKIHVLYRGPKADQEKPKLFVLSVGISSYIDHSFDNPFAGNDAGALINTLKKQQNLNYETVEHRLLLNEGAELGAILDGLEWLQNQAGANDVSIVYLSCQGLTDQNDSYLILPYDVKRSSLKASSLTATSLVRELKNVKGRVLLFADLAYKSPGANNFKTDPLGLIQAFSRTDSSTIVYATSDMQGGNTLAQSLIAAFEAKPESPSQKTLSFKALNAYLNRRISQLSGGTNNLTIMVPQSIADFDLGVRQ